MLLKNKAIIVASEVAIDLHRYFQEGYLIVGIERGALFLIKQKIPIDLAIGDFDKVSQKELTEIKHYASETILVSPEKDYLDGELAILELRKRGIQKIKFIAQPTRRYDKNISICDLVWKYDIIFFNEDTLIFRLNQGLNKLSYQKYKEKKYISFLANQPSIVTINDFKYNIKNFCLMPFDNRTISNEFVPELDGKISTNKALIAILSV